MKRFLVLMTFFLGMLATQAQDKTVLLKASDNSLFNYGRTAVKTTTDSTLTTLSTVTVGDDEAGVIEVMLVGFNDSTSTAVTGAKIVRYVKDAGTLTLGTPTSSLATVTDATLGTATWSVTTSSNNIIVQVKGKAGFTIRWQCTVRRVYRKTG
jgi:hypothetical protein